MLIVKACNMSDEKNKRKDETIKELIEIGSDLSGSISGSVIGGLIAGPIGSVVGGASGPIITRVFKTIGHEIKNRLIGKREEIRIGAAYTFAINKIKSNEEKGFQLRKDAFFDMSENGRSIAEEILEGIVITSQKEYEERKVKFIGNLYGNICTKQEINREFANQLIKITSDLSFRQFCLLRLFQVRHDNKYPIDAREITKLDLTLEIRDLQQKRLIMVGETLSPGRNDSNPFRYNIVKINNTGLILCEMLSLEEIEKEDVDNLESELGAKQ
jgi:hypothetical protein